MKVTDIEVRVVRLPSVQLQWHRNLPVSAPQLSFVSVRTDEGISGHASTWLPAPLHEVADAVEQFIRPLVVGRELDDREAIWQELQKLEYFFPIRTAVSGIDIALWDAAAKAADRPVHRLLGSVRDRLPAYASVPPMDSVDDAVDAALACQRQGFHGFKLHSHGDADVDIEACRALRDAVGPAFALMLDPVNAYDRHRAGRVAAVLDGLDFTWLEAPLPDDDVQGYHQLRARYRVPISNGELRPRGLRDFRELLRAEAVDIVRFAAEVQGGITGGRKVSALSEAFDVPMELRAYGSTLVQAAHLHIGLASPTCRFFEIPVPVGWLDFGMVGGVEMGADGYVSAPSRSGLGYEVDWDAVDDATVLRV